MGKVAIFLTAMPVGGAQRIALNLCKGLVKRGHEVDLVLQDATGDLLEELPADVTVIDLDATRVATSVTPLRSYLKTHEPDVLYSMMIEVNIIAVLACQFANVETRLVISEHNTPTVSAEGLKDQIVLQLAKVTYPRADHVVTVSNGVREDLQAVVKLPDDKVDVIYNPIDVDRIRDQATAPLDHRWLSSEEHTVIISAGRHVPQKGFDTLLRAFRQLEQDDLRLVLLGEGDQTESLQSLAAELGIQERVDFPGFVDNPFKYMSRADLFVLSSWYEGFGNVLIEAMATGCPVVATDCPSGPSEILEEGTYGRLVPVKNPAAMATAMDQTLVSPPADNKLRARADRFSIETITREYEKILFQTETHEA